MARKETEFKFEVTIPQYMLEGDEFWEDCLEEDPTGVKPLLNILKELIIESNIIIGHNDKIDEVVRYVSNPVNPL